MGNLPGWLSAIGILFTIAAVLGAAVAVFRTSLYEAKLKDAERTIANLRGDISDYVRREAEYEKQVVTLQGDVKGLEQGRIACNQRITDLQQALSMRTDDAELRASVAELKKAVDERVMSMLVRIEGEVRAGRSEDGTAHA